MQLRFCFDNSSGWRLNSIDKELCTHLTIFSILISFVDWLMSIMGNEHFPTPIYSCSVLLVGTSFAKFFWRTEQTLE